MYSLVELLYKATTWDIKLGPRREIGLLSECTFYCSK